MKPIKYYIDCFLSNRFFIGLGICIFIFIASFYIPIFWHLAWVSLILFFIIVLLDYGFLFFTKKYVVVIRTLDDKLSNGDENFVKLKVKNPFNFSVYFSIIDEIPFQFQKRDFEIKGKLSANEIANITYKLIPNQRGEYLFGDVHFFAITKIGMVVRRFTNETKKAVKVYPSFLQLRSGELVGIVNQNEVGNLKHSKISTSLEFDHIKDYINGDDRRTINWRASARSNKLMVNTYIAEQSQQIYCIIDMGRIMKMPFNKMSLLDYSINSALMLSYTVLHKKDKIGLFTFAEKTKDILKASQNKNQLSKINELLYKQETNFLESNYEELMSAIQYNVGQRSLLMLYTNFETFNSLERQLPYLLSIAKKHLLCIVIFENEELKNIHQNYDDTLEGIYVKTITDKFTYEKKRIIKELTKNGILTVYTTPKNLNTDMLNKYIQLKNQRVL